MHAINFQCFLCPPHFVLVRPRVPAVPWARIQWSPTKSGANLMIRRRRRDGRRRRGRRRGRRRRTDVMIYVANL